jgi:hypothetical protein
MPTATRVAGLYAWNQLGRKVKKGEKGIRILAPIVGIKRKKDEEAERDITKQNTRVLVGFRNAYVFDATQTEGAELPSLREMRGTVGENQGRLVSFIKAQSIELVFTEKIAPESGKSYGGKIVILPGQSEAEEFSTLVHELAHDMLHKAERRTSTTKVVRETEAEATGTMLICHPCCKLSRSICIDTREHLGVLCPAILRALPEVEADSLRIDPHGIHFVGNEVHLPSKPGNPEAMVCVCGRHR